ncbi:MAG: exodeoxyribonuclease III [Deltaproteobacteria bacterium]|nr:exodeoxyribonuclease III [Deltaproteobacteria bacterium]
MAKSSSPSSGPVKLVSWNVNGIRSALGKGFLEFVAGFGPDVLCLQETRAEPEQVGMDLNGYHAYWNPAQKKGYSGTALFSRLEPLSITTGPGGLLEDTEGRVITAEYPGLFLVNVYTPNAQRGLTRLEHRGQWDAAFLDYLRLLDGKKPVVFCGDLNVAHREIDLANPRANINNAGFTPRERQGFENILRAGFMDTFREFTGEGGHYTWWSMRKGVREKNIGWRIDYFCISARLRPRLKNAFILPAVLGSDHCPVVMELEGLD